MYNNVIRVVGVQGEATKKQLEYAKQISETLNVEMPEKTDKQTLCDFIGRYARRYKRATESA